MLADETRFNSRETGSLHAWHAFSSAYLVCKHLKPDVQLISFYYDVFCLLFVSEECWCCVWRHWMTQRSLGILWKSIGPSKGHLPEQHTTFTREKIPCSRRESNPKPKNLSAADICPFSVYVNRNVFCVHWKEEPENEIQRKKTLFFLRNICGTYFHCVSKIHISLTANAAQSV
jgi:hypothetical protein